jgi:hypothetical protein
VTSLYRQFRYSISALETVVLMENVVKCEDANNDADRTVEELISEIDAFDGYVSKTILEAALYCCNIQSEDKKFWHPHGWSFDQFVHELLPKYHEFNKYYNWITRKDKDGNNAETGR